MILVIFWKFGYFCFDPLATFLHKINIKDAMNSELYFCQGYPIKFCSFLVVLILCKTTLRLLELLFVRDVTCLNLHKLQKNI